MLWKRIVHAAAAVAVSTALLLAPSGCRKHQRPAAAPPAGYDNAGSETLRRTPIQTN
jgi:hypothetical protein